jgi:hypothetical protein
MQRVKRRMAYTMGKVVGVVPKEFSGFYDWYPTI